MRLRQFLDFLLELVRLFKPDQRKWIVRIFVTSGIPLVSSKFWQPWIEKLLEREFGFDFSYASTPGWILIFLGVALYIFNEWQRKEAKKEPTFTENRENLNFSLGGGGITCGYSGEQLRKQPSAPFNFGGHLPVKVYVKGTKLYADVEVFSGSGMPPIKIEQNKLSGLPSNWDSNKNENALEIVDQNGNPIYQFLYKNDGHIVLNGIFPYPGGLVLADDTSMVVNPRLPARLQLKKIFKYPSWKYPAVYET